MHARLAEVMDYVDKRRTDLLKSFSGAESSALARRPSEDGWSVAQILDHLGIVESGVARLVAKRVAQAREHGVAQEQSAESVMTCFDAHARKIESVKLVSPEPVRPRLEVDADQAIAGLESSRAALRAAVAAADGVALGEIKHPHPIFGDLDLYQWLIFLGGHEARHARQIERTLAGARDTSHSSDKSR